jgi:hypothetical protein
MLTLTSLEGRLYHVYFGFQVKPKIVSNGTRVRNISCAFIVKPRDDGPLDHFDIDLEDARLEPALQAVMNKSRCSDCVSVSGFAMFFNLEDHIKILGHSHVTAVVFRYEIEN